MFRAWGCIRSSRPLTKTWIVFMVESVALVVSLISMVFLPLVEAPGGGVTTRTLPTTRTAFVLTGGLTRLTVTVPGVLVRPGLGAPTLATVYWKLSVPEAPVFGV